MYRSDVDSFFMYLQAYTGARLPRRDSLVVFDEVQRFPPAREFIKQLVADGRYDYLETGSLISIRRNVEGIVIPSEETPLRLNPLGFEEFLWACGEEALANLIRSSAEDLSPLPAPLHRKAERLFREYMLVGGMPQAVSEYLEARDFGRVDAVKRDILSLYRNDIAKFGGADATRIARVFSTLPGQLAKHDRKFRLVSLDANARGRDYADAFFWLSDAFITSTCLNATDPSVGLAATADESSFKCYMGDTGLLVSHLFADNGRRRTRCTATSSSGSSRSTRDVHRERRRPAARVQRARPVLLLQARRQGLVEHDGGGLPRHAGLRRRRGQDARVARRGEVHEALRRPLARQVQGQVRQPRRDEVHPAPAAHGGLRRPGEAAALRLHGAVGRVWHRLPRRQPVEGRGPGRRPGAPASIPDSGVKKARLADRHKRARAPRPHNLGSDARKNKVIR